MLYRPAPVSEEPGYTLTNWSVHSVLFEDGTQSDHVVGELVAGPMDGRVSSKIVEVRREPDALHATTRSGRVYKLPLGAECQPRGDGEYVFNRWCHINGVESTTDVTPFYLERN